MMTHTLIRLTDPEAARAQGVPVDTEHQLRWLYRTREEKGISLAFVKIGRSVLLDPQKFHDLVRERAS